MSVRTQHGRGYRCNVVDMDVDMDNGRTGVWMDVRAVGEGEIDSAKKISGDKLCRPSDRNASSESEKT